MRLIILFVRVCPVFCRTLDEDVYAIALSLAKRYSVPLWEVHMTHLEFLFTDSGYVHKHALHVAITSIIYPTARCCRHDNHRTHSGGELINRLRRGYVFGRTFPVSVFFLPLSA